MRPWGIGDQGSEPAGCVAYAVDVGSSAAGASPHSVLSHYRDEFSARGWAIDSSTGEAVTARRDGLTIEVKIVGDTRQYFDLHLRLLDEGD